jgi:hypothetical protein
VSEQESPPGPGSPASKLWAMVSLYPCQLLAGLILLTHLGGIAMDLRPARGQIKDFFQEWASARNYLTGLPVYTEHAVTLPLYLGLHQDPRDVCFVEINAHPPTAVLLALPFAGLSYEWAQFCWNLLSLAALVISGWVIVSALEIPRSSGFLLLAVLVLVGEPVHQHLIQGQLGCLLLLLITGVWLADRSERPFLAGALLGLATAIKLLPGLLVLYFVARRQWKTAFIAAACFAMTILATASVLGLETFRSYLSDVPAHVAEWRSVPHNHSIPGLWNKLFDQGSKGEPMIPVTQWPALAKGGSMLSCAAVVLLLVRVAARAKLPTDRDQAFGVAVTAMLLVSPVTWGHYFVLLMLPLALLWLRVPSRGWMNGVFWAALVALSVKPLHLWHLCGLWNWRTSAISPWHTATALSMQLYALLALFALSVWAANSAPAKGRTFAERNAQEQGSRALIREAA